MAHPQHTVDRAQVQEGAVVEAYQSTDAPIQQIMDLYGISHAPTLYKILRRHSVPLRSRPQRPAPAAPATVNAYHVTMHVVQTIRATDLQAALAQLAAEPWVREVIGIEAIDEAP